MAARRLIVVMLVLLGVSTVIAIITPDQADRAQESAQTGPTDVNGSTGATGATGNGAAGPGDQSPAGDSDGSAAAGQGGDSPGTREVVIKVSGGSRERPPSVTAPPGSRLVLTVEANDTIDLALPDFGLNAVTTEFAPAVFDLIVPDETGSYDLTELASGEVLATIEAGSLDSADEQPGG